MTNKEKYIIFLIEQFRFKQGISANATYNLFKEKGILEYINNTFEAIHTLDTNFVLSEIEDFVKKQNKNNLWLPKMHTPDVIMDIEKEEVQDGV